MLHERVMRRAGGAGGSSQCSCTRQTALGELCQAASLTPAWPPPASPVTSLTTIMHCLLQHSPHCLLPVQGPDRASKYLQFFLCSLLIGQCTAEFYILPRTLPLNVEIDGGDGVQFTKYSAEFLQTHIQTGQAGSVHQLKQALG